MGKKSIFEPRSVNSQSQRRLDVLLWLYFLDFTYSGILRAIFPDFWSNILYFTRGVITLGIFVLIKEDAKRVRKRENIWLMPFIFLLFLLGLISLVVNRVNPITFTYGLYMYVLPFLPLVVVNKVNCLSSFLKLKLSIYFSILMNLIYVIAQTVLGNANFFSAGFGPGLYSALNVQRATGTFTSTAGFSAYLMVVIAFLLLDTTNHGRFEKGLRLCVQGSLLAIIGLSGSRLVIYSVVISIFMIGMGQLLKDPSKLFRLRISYGIVILVIWVTLTTYAATTINAFKIRFISANEVDGPIARLIATWSIPDDWQIIGSGFGSRSRGSLILKSEYEFLEKWIEADNARIAIEGGILVFFLLTIFKLFLILKAFTTVMRARKPAHFEILVLLSVLIPLLAFGQIFGQGSVASASWLLIYVLFGLFQSKRSSL